MSHANIFFIHIVIHQSHSVCFSSNTYFGILFNIARNAEKDNILNGFKIQLQLCFVKAFHIKSRQNK